MKTYRELEPVCRVRLAVAIAAAIALLAPRALWAERFLSPEQAARLCFAGANRFETQTVRFTADQTKEIQSAIRQRLINKGHRYWLAWNGTNLLGILVVDHVMGKHEVIDYAVALSPAGTVNQVEILEYRESHGREIRGKKWRRQFIGRDAQDPLRLNEDIHNISGATISCRNVSDGIRRVLVTFDRVIRPDLPGSPAADDPAGDRVSPSQAGKR